MADGFTESVTIDEGVDHQGIRTQFHFESDGGIVVQKTTDLAPHLEYAANARRETQGMNWGEGKFVGHIPPLDYFRISQIRDRKEREKAVRLYFQERPALVMFDRFLKK